MYEVEVREVGNPTGENLAVLKQRHPVVPGTLIRFECSNRSLILVGMIVQVLIDHTGYDFESVCVWVQITDARPMNDPSY